MGKLESLQTGARKAGHLEQDESVQQFALTKGGSRVVKGEEGTMKSLGRIAMAQGGRGALLATDRSLHVVGLGQIGFKSVKEEHLNIPIGDAALSKKGNLLKVGTRDDPFLWYFTLPPYVSNIKQLTRYVESRAEAP